MRDLKHLIQAFKDATKAMEDYCYSLQKEYHEFEEHSRIVTNDWHVWRTKRDNPRTESFIIVRRDNKIWYAYYNGDRRFFIIGAQVRGECLQSYIMDCQFTDGDEWIEVETLKK